MIIYFRRKNDPRAKRLVVKSSGEQLVEVCERDRLAEPSWRIENSPDIGPVRLLTEAVFHIQAHVMQGKQDFAEITLGTLSP